MFKICSKCNIKKQYPEKFFKGTKKKDGSYCCTTCKECYNKSIRKQKLKTGRIKTTPHGTPRENLTGKKFGKLTVIEYSGIKQYKYNKRHIWLCKCKCGNIKKINENSLKNSNTKSCGCLKTCKKYKEIIDIYLYRIKHGAKRRNLEFNITVEYIWNLFTEQNKKCSLSKLDLNFAKNIKEHLAGYTTASLDRIDSTKGYIEGNVQWLHKKVNKIKLDLNQSEFIDLCKIIANNN